LKKFKNPAMHDPSSKQTVVCAHRLDPSWSELWVKEKFSEFGKVVNVDLPLHRNGRRKGLAFVHYATVEGARLAVSSLSNFKF
jgi:RNA recognition motif-containing protein